MAPRVLHFAYLDSTGGSGRSAYRIHQSLRARGYHSQMLVGKKHSTDPNVRVLGGKEATIPYLGFLLDRAGRVASDITGLQDVLIPSSLWLEQHPWVQKADVLQFFNTWGAFVSFTALARLSQKRPVVWRLSDEWLYTGHCVYTYDCDRWLEGCGNCPQVHGERALPFDTSALLWKLKQATYQHANLVLVAPSTWIMHQAQRSPLIGHFPIHHIPNGVDTSIYRPMQQEARAALGIDSSARVVLFAAQNLETGRKGGHLLRQALEQIQNIPSATLLLIGAGAVQAIPGWDVISIGFTQDDHTLAQVFSAADVMALPTLADNLPNTILESMACGTPVVGFAVGGMPDVVKHIDTGYLAAPNDVDDLSHGLRTLLHDKDLCQKLGQQSRNLALSEFTLETEADAFDQLYQSLLTDI